MCKRDSLFLLYYLQRTLLCHQMWRYFPHNDNSVELPAGSSTIQSDSDIICLELGSDPTGSRQAHRTAHSPTSRAKRKP